MDSIGDFLTTIRNGVARSKPFVVVPYSRMKLEMAQLLLQEGFIRAVDVMDAEHAKHKVIQVSLKYVHGESVIHEIVRLSRPGRRLYQRVGMLGHIAGGFGIAIVSTNRGVITNKQARELAVGGELLCSVW